MDSDLKHKDQKPKKKSEEVSVVEVTANLLQVKMECDMLRDVNKDLVVENLALKHKTGECLKQIKDLKKSMKNLSHGKEQELSNLRSVFLNKK